MDPQVGLSGLAPTLRCSVSRMEAASAERLTACLVPACSGGHLRGTHAVLLGSRPWLRADAGGAGRGPAGAVQLMVTMQDAEWLCWGQRWGLHMPSSG